MRSFFRHQLGVLCLFLWLCCSLPCAASSVASGEELAFGPNDVLSGRTDLSYNHIGNRRFREVVGQFLDDYKAANSRAEKYQIVLTIGEEIAKAGGRFLKADENDDTGNTWVELEPAIVRQTIAHAIRDTIKEKMLAENGQALHPIKPVAMPSDNDESQRIHIGNMTCAFFEQPLNHFFVPKEESPTYHQRYCVYNQFVKNMSTAPIFFYTGNESPLEQYINNTGLMWELAPEFNAQVIFMEHRYEGKSLPAPSIRNCLSYSSSKQAIEDYARFLEELLVNSTIQANNGSDPGILTNRRPVIVFGGSYGGMLSAWFRMKYPQLVTGAIAASAPIWALPRTNPTMIDGAFQVIKRGLQLPYPPTDSKDKEKQKQQPVNHCMSNLLASWPLMKYLAHAEEQDDKPGLGKLTELFRLCKPLEHVHELMSWIRTPWFDMAEGSFPYASSYIPFALIKSNGTILKLPPWPLQAACWNESQLYKDWGVKVDGNISTVLYNVTYGDSGLSLSIDWDTMTNSSAANLSSVLESPQIEGLLTSVRDAVAVWYNITQDEPCFNLTPAINMRTAAGLHGMHRISKKTTMRNVYNQLLGSKNVNGVRDGHTTTLPEESKLLLENVVTTSSVRRALKHGNHNATAECESRISEGSWNALCCNEEMNMMIYEAAGMGRDMLWPPQYPRDTLTYADVIRHDAEQSNDTVPGYCLDPERIFGYSQLPVDPWSTRLDTYYGGTRVEGFSNIVFSNGLLDPWMAGGVNVPSVNELNPTDPFATPSYDGPMVRPIGPESQNMIALMIEFGGHHTDLMYSAKEDPECVTKAREVEKSYIAKWIKEAQVSVDDEN